MAILNGQEEASSLIATMQSEINFLPQTLLMEAMEKSGVKSMVDQVPKGLTKSLVNKKTGRVIEAKKSKNLEKNAKACKDKASAAAKQRTEAIKSQKEALSKRIKDSASDLAKELIANFSEVSENLAEAGVEIQSAAQVFAAGSPFNKGAAAMELMISGSKVNHACTKVETAINKTQIEKVAGMLKMVGVDTSSLTSTIKSIKGPIETVKKISKTVAGLDLTSALQVPVSAPIKAVKKSLDSAIDSAKNKVIAKVTSGNSDISSLISSLTGTATGTFSSLSQTATAAASSVSSTVSSASSSVSSNISDRINS